MTRPAAPSLGSPASETRRAPCSALRFARAGVRASARVLRSVAGLLCVLAAPPAVASDTHYQDLLLGQRAMGMGGAFVALADDPSSTFYNPAGLSLMSQSAAGASFGLYGIERRSIDGGFGNPLENADLRQTSFPMASSTFAAAAKFGSGPVPRNAVAFSIFLPYSESIGQRALVQRGGESAVYQLNENDRVLWVGPSYARRFRSGLALGFSLFYENRSFSRASEYSNFFLSPRTGQACAGSSLACALSTSIDMGTGSLFLRVGALWRVDAEWRFGVAFSTPNVHLHGTADITSRRFSALPSGGVDFAVVGAGDQSATTRRPFEIRIGAAYEERDAFTLSLDVSLHGPLTYRRIDSPAFIADPLFVREVRRDTVVNVNLGAELHPRYDIPVRFGLFTNFSSAPELPDLTTQPFLQRIHLFGASASVGYRGESYGLDFGVTGQFGTGVTQAFDAVDQTLLRRTGTTYARVYFFINGIGTVIARNLSRLLEKFN